MTRIIGTAMTTKTGMNEFDQILEDHDDNKLQALYRTCLEQLKQEQIRPR